MNLRSVNPELRDSLDAEIDRRVARAAEAHGVESEKEEVTRNEAGGTEEMLADRFHHPVVQTAIAVHRHLGIDVCYPDPASVLANARSAGARLRSRSAEAVTHLT